MAVKILVVEDDFALAENLNALLKIEGFQVAHAPDGLAALEMVKKDKPDLILLDAMLPKMGGFDVCRMVRSEPKTQSVKIIMMTGLGKVGDVDKAFSAGASDYLLKPFDNERLLKKINKVLGV